ncbi:hypothetical protein ACVWZ6_007497 [Bradyrhizobium sp. GM6.1]
MNAARVARNGLDPCASMALCNRGRGAPVPIAERTPTETDIRVFGFVGAGWFLSHRSILGAS